MGSKVAKRFHDESLPMTIRERLKRKGQAVHKLQIKEKQSNQLPYPQGDHNAI